MISGMMEHMFQNMTKEDIKEMFLTLMPEIMDKSLANMTGQEVSELLHNFMPGTLEKCFVKMDNEQKKKLIAMWRTMLEEMEKRHLSD
jgi:hypothetical protein